MRSISLSLKAFSLTLLLLAACSTHIPPAPVGLPIPHDDDSNTSNPIDALNPASGTYGGTTYPGQLYNFASREDAARYNEQGFNNTVSVLANATACLGAPIAGLTMTPVACVAYNAGYRGIETGPITFPNGSTCWVAMDENTSGNNAGLPNFTRAGTTHYLIDCIDVGQPSMANDSQLLMKVVTAGGAITTVTDLRTTTVAVNSANNIGSGTGPQIAQYPGGTSKTVVPASVGGDCVIAQGGIVTCLRSNGVPFVASATTDTTNATNIASGTLNNSRLPTTITVAHVVGSTDITDSGLTPSRCVQTGTGGILVSSAGNCATTAGIAQGGPLTQALAAGGFRITGLGAVVSTNDALSEGSPIGATSPSTGTFTQVLMNGGIQVTTKTTSESTGGTITPNLLANGGGNIQVIIITDNGGWTLANPSSSGISALTSQPWYLLVANTSGGAGGTITLGTSYRTDTSWSTTGPANNKIRVCPVMAFTNSNYIGPCTGDETYP